MRRTLSRWRRRQLPEGPTRVLTLDPPCSKCGSPTARVVLGEYTDGWRLTFVGVEGSGSGSGDPISAEKAKAITDALTPPYESARIEAAGFYDDFGFCTSCAEAWNEPSRRLLPRGTGTAGRTRPRRLVAFLR